MWAGLLLLKALRYFSASRTDGDPRRSLLVAVLSQSLQLNPHPGADEAMTTPPQPPSQEDMGHLHCGAAGFLSLGLKAFLNGCVFQGVQTCTS